MTCLPKNVREERERGFLVGPRMRYYQFICRYIPLSLHYLSLSLLWPPILHCLLHLCICVSNLKLPLEEYFNSNSRVPSSKRILLRKPKMNIQSFFICIKSHQINYPQNTTPLQGEANEIDHKQNYITYLITCHLSVCHWTKGELLINHEPMNFSSWSVFACRIGVLSETFKRKRHGHNLAHDIEI